MTHAVPRRLSAGPTDRQPHTKRRRRLAHHNLIAFLPLLGLIAGCSAPNIGGETIYASQIYRGHPLSYIASGSSATQNVATTVVGNPFGVSQNNLATAVAASMNASVRDVGTRFAVIEGEPVLPAIGAVVVFNPIAGASAAGLCKVKGNARTVPSTGDIQIFMALCVQSEPLSSVRAKLARDRDPSTSSFARLIKRMTEQLVGVGFQPRRPVPD